jgi:hypothetical protein
MTMTKTTESMRRWLWALRRLVAMSVWLLSICSCMMMATTADAASSSATTAAASFWTDHPDRVKILPGYTMGTPPVTMLSGYLHYEFEGEQVHTHYMLFKAEEAFFADDEEPPLLYWSSK